jgi:hypothetical protein
LFGVLRNKNAIAGYQLFPLNAGPLQADHTFIAQKSRDAL